MNFDINYYIKILFLIIHGNTESKIPNIIATISEVIITVKVFNFVSEKVGQQDLYNSSKHSDIKFFDFLFIIPKYRTIKLAIILAKAVVKVKFSPKINLFSFLKKTNKSLKAKFNITAIINAVIKKNKVNHVFLFCILSP